MSNKKQSSVDWLFQKLWDEPKDKFTWYAILKEAKEMEKEQIIDAHIEGDNTYTVGFAYYDAAEQYYNKTFGGKDEQQ